MGRTIRQRILYSRKGGRKIPTFNPYKKITIDTTHPANPLPLFHLVSNFNDSHRIEIPKNSSRNRSKNPISYNTCSGEEKREEEEEKKHVSQHAPCPLFEMESVNWAGEMGITAGCTSVDVYGIERCAHKDMRVHGTTPRARSAVHTSLIRAGVKPVVRGAGHKRGAQQRTNRVHPNWTGNLVACPTNLAHNPPLPPLFPRSRLNRARPSIHRITRSSSFSRGQSIEGGGSKVRQEMEKSASSPIPNVPSVALSSGIR